MLYPIGLQNFEDLRKNNYLYVDKTHHIYNLATTGKYYFLSRPRRFGKSLLLSTMEAYFKGKRELFKGLAIEQLEKEWAEYPVLHLDLNGSVYSSEVVIDKVLNDNLSCWEKLYGVNPTSDEHGLRFQRVIDAAYEKTGRQVVILIDEYEKPIVDNLGNPELAEYFKRTFKASIILDV